MSQLSVTKATTEPHLSQCQILLWDQLNIGPWYKKHMVPTTAHLAKLGIPTMFFLKSISWKPKPSKLKPKEHRKTNANKKNVIHFAEEKQKHVPISLFRTLSAYSAHFIGSFHKKGSCFRHHSIHFSQENQQKLNTLQTHIPKLKGCIQPVQTASTSNFCDVQHKLTLKMSLKLPHFMSTFLPLLFLGCWIWSKRPVPPKISTQSLNDSMVRCASLCKFEILPHSPAKSTPPESQHVNGLIAMLNMRYMFKCLFSYCHVTFHGRMTKHYQKHRNHKQNPWSLESQLFFSEVKC